MIVKQKIDFYCGDVVHTIGDVIEVLDLRSELSDDALKEYEKYKSICHNGYLYSLKA